MTLEALSADEESLQSKFKPQPRRGQEDLPWRKARERRRQTKEKQRLDDTKMSLAGDSGSYSGMSNSEDSAPSTSVRSASCCV